MVFEAAAGIPQRSQHQPGGIRACICCAPSRHVYAMLHTKSPALKRHIPPANLILPVSSTAVGRLTVSKQFTLNDFKVETAEISKRLPEHFLASTGRSLTIVPLHITVSTC